MLAGQTLKNCADVLIAVIFASMKLIINEIYELEGFDHEKLAKYIRCMFQAILPLDDGPALQLIDQALQICCEGEEVRPSLLCALFMSCHCHFFHDC